MRKIGLLILIFSIISCKNEVKKDFAVLSGKITNKLGKSITLNSIDRTFKEAIDLSEEGVFNDTLRIPEGHYFLTDKKNIAELYIKNGEDLSVKYNASDFKKTLNITGFGSEISNYLFSKAAKENEIKGEGTKVYTLNEKNYRATFQKIKDTINEMILSAKNIPDDFKEKEQRNINYAYLNAINRYQRYHAHYAKLPNFKVSKDFLGDLNSNVIYSDAGDFKFSDEYRTLVTNFYKKQASVLANKDSIDEDLALLKVASLIPTDIIKNDLLFNDAKYGITYTENLEEFYKTFMDASTNKKQKEEITKSYNKLKTVSKGQLSPKFIGYENFKGGTTSLDDLKGKYIYVDVWATWCGPCKAEIPSLKKIEKKYHIKNINFVSISVDKLKDHDKWEKMVKEKELQGIQLFADDDWNSDFVKEYLILGIPRFILIDPNGKIVNSNAPRPSDSRLEDLFKSLKI